MESHAKQAAALKALKEMLDQHERMDHGVPLPVP